MIKTVRDAWQIPELRKKILFTIFALLIFRLGAAIPVALYQHRRTGDLSECPERYDFGSDECHERFRLFDGDPVRPEHSALYQQLHHHSAAYRGHSRLGAAGQGGR